MVTDPPKDPAESTVARARAIPNGEAHTQKPEEPLRWRCFNCGRTAKSPWHRCSESTFGGQQKKWLTLR